MDQFIFIADLHLHPTPIWRYEWLRVKINELLGSYRRNYPPMVLLGDIFEQRNAIDNRIIDLFIYLIARWDNEIYWITGQHDSTVPLQASFRSFSFLNNVTIIDNAPRWITPGLLAIPYSRDLEYYRSMLTKVENDVHRQIYNSSELSKTTLLTHIPVREALNPSFTEGIDFMEVREFKNFRRVISGDIHPIWKKNNFEYLGAFSQRDFRDMEVEGCYGLYNLKKNKLSRILTNHPVHLDINNEDQIPMDKKCIIRVPSNLDLDVENLENVLGIKKKIEKIEHNPIQAPSLKTDPFVLIDDYINSSGLPQASKKIYSKIAKEIIGGTRP